MARASLDPDAVNLENVGKGERAIAMDLGLGVYDAPGVGDSVNGHGGGLGPVVNSDSTGLKEEDSDSDSDSDSEEDLDAGEGKAESEDTSSSSESESESGSASDADKASSA
jgi:clumping factor A